MEHNTKMSCRWRASGENSERSGHQNLFKSLEAGQRSRLCSNAAAQANATCGRKVRRKN